MVGWLDDLMVASTVVPWVAQSAVWKAGRTAERWVGWLAVTKVVKLAA
jgi:uncharacterized membrane protein YkvA (DUF1232 family)